MVRSATSRRRINRRRSNRHFFDGRLLTAEDLRQEQATSTGRRESAATQMSIATLADRAFTEIGAEEAA